MKMQDKASCNTSEKLPHEQFFISSLLSHTSYQKSRFTLIELLVVIAVIAVLAGMLLPALGKSKATVKNISCLNNVKTASTVFRMYSDDSNGLLPSIYDAGCATFIALHSLNAGEGKSLLHKTMVLYNMSSPGDEKLLCPSVEIQCPRAAPVTWKTSADDNYSFNSQIACRRKSGNFISTAGLRRPSSTVIACETYQGSNCGVVPDGVNLSTLRGSYGRGLDFARHGGKANFAFVDGHAESMSLQLVPVNSVYYSSISGTARVDTESGGYPVNTYFWGGGPVPGRTTTECGM